MIDDKGTVEEAWLAGDALLRIRQQLPHGAWLPARKERAFSIYQERFADFSDLTFLFVGNFDVEQMVEWLQISLGNLPSLHRVETWQHVLEHYTAKEGEFYT